MKTFITTVSSILLLSLFTNCGSAQQKNSQSPQFDEKAPFTIKKASYQNIIGGIPGSSQTNVTIEIISNSSQKIEFDSIYFNQKIQPINVLISGEKKLISNSFFKNTPQRKDLIMDIDPKREMGNTVPEIKQNIPFKLADSECVISYKVDGEKRYYRMKNLKKSKSVYMQ